MARVFEIILLIFLASVMTGCGQAEQGDLPIWEKIKIWQLGKNSDEQKETKTAFFNVYEFSIPAEKHAVLEDIASQLYTQPVRYYNARVFRANNFYAGYGRARKWNEIREKLVEAGAKGRSVLTLMLSYGYASDLMVGYLENEKHLFYTSQNGAKEALSIGPGQLVLRIEAVEIPGERGVCFLDVKPALPTKFEAAYAPAGSEGTKGRVFRSSGFKIKMGAGDMIFISPRDETGKRMSLAGIFLSEMAPKPVLKGYLFVCTKIRD